MSNTVTDPLVKEELVAATVFSPPSTGLKLRDFVQRVENIAELKEIRGAHWDLEIGALTEVSASLADSKALLFDEIVGYPKGYRVLTNDDVDPSNTSDVLWAMGTRCDPATSIEVAHSCWSTPIDPRIGPHERQRRNFTSSRGIIDACKPFHWIKEFPSTSTITQQDFEETMHKSGAILSTNK